MNPAKFFGELKRRNVYKVAEAYVVAGRAHMGLGDNETAIQYLDQAYDIHENIEISSIKVDPLLDPLRDESRFRELVAKMFSDNVK